MLEKVVGGCIVLICFLLGGFLALASFFAIMDGKGEEYLYLLAACGVGLLVVGFVLMLKLAQPRPVKRLKVEGDEDEGW